MNVRAIILACALIPPAATTASGPPAHSLALANGDRLQGNVTAFTHGESLTLSHPDAPAPLVFRMAAVTGINTLASGDPGQEPPDPAILTLADGDRLPVSILSYDGKELAAGASWTASRLAIPRASIDRMEFIQSAAKRLFHGPAAGQDWKFISENTEAGGLADNKPRQGWWLENNHIAGSTPGAAAINPNLPDLARIEFDVQWQGPLNFGIAFYADSFEPADPENPGGQAVIDDCRATGQTVPLRHGIALDINPHAVVLQIHSPDNGQDMIGSAPMPPGMRSQTSARFSIHTDRKTGTLALAVDGKSLQKWTDIGEFPGTGNAIALWQHHDNGTVQLSNLSVRQWNGKFEPEQPAQNPENDTIVAADGSRVSGRLLNLRDDNWNIATDIGELHVASPDIRHIIHAARKTGATKPPPLPAVNLHGGFILHLANPRLSPDGRLSGEHRILGPLDFAFSAVESITFPAPES